MSSKCSHSGSELDGNNEDDDDLPLSVRLGSRLSVVALESEDSAAASWLLATVDEATALLLSKVLLKLFLLSTKHEQMLFEAAVPPPK